MKIKSTDVVGGGCMLGNDGTPYFSEKDKAKLWKAYMPKSMIEENECDQITDADTIEETIERAMRDKYLLIGKAPGPFEFYAEMILVSADI